MNFENQSEIGVIGVKNMKQSLGPKIQKIGHSGLQYIVGSYLPNLSHYINDASFLVILKMLSVAKNLYNSAQFFYKVQYQINIYTMILIVYQCAICKLYEKMLIRSPSAKASCIRAQNRLTIFGLSRQ